MRDMEPGEAGNPLTQLRRGVIEHCVLALLVDQEMYGFDLVRRLAGADLVTSEGTIYPLLSRLRKVGWVSTHWRESDAGPPRRYYTITPAGTHALTGFRRDWQRFRDSVDELMEIEDGASND